MSQGINELYSKEILLKRNEELSYKGEKICIASGASAEAIVRPVAHVLAPEPHNRGLTPYRGHRNKDFYLL
jgi:hypothetical protein